MNGLLMRRAFALLTSFVFCAVLIPQLSADLLPGDVDCCVVTVEAKLQRFRIASDKFSRDGFGEINSLVG